MRILGKVSLGTSLALLSACASTSPAPNPELEQLRKANLELRRDAAMHKVEIDRLRKQIVALEKERDTRVAVQPEQRTEHVQDSFSAETSSSQQSPVEEIDLVEPPPQAVSAKPEAQPHRLLDEQQLYDASYALFHEQDYERAAAHFEQFIDAFPSSELADNAQFWIGECHYARGKFEEALAAFTLTVERYPRGNKVADSLLKAGRCLAGLGDQERADQTYREVQSRFPGTGAAATAAELLRER